MKTTIWMASVTMLMMLFPNKLYANDEKSTVDKDSSSFNYDFLLNMTDTERDAYYDSIYWANHPWVELVLNTDTSKIVNPPVRQDNNFDYSNNYVPNSVSISTSKAVGQIDIVSGMAEEVPMAKAGILEGFKLLQGATRVSSMTALQRESI